MSADMHLCTESSGLKIFSLEFDGMRWTTFFEGVVGWS